MVHFPLIIHIVKRCSSFSLIAWPKKFVWCLPHLFISDFVVSPSLKQFRVISLQSMRFVALFKGNTFLLPPVSFVSALKLSRPVIYTSEWVQYSTSRLFLCEWRCVYLLEPISFSGNILLAVFLMQFQFFFCFFFLHPSLDIKVPNYLNRSICLSIFLLIKMLIFGHSFFPLTTITPVFLLFNSNPFPFLENVY